MDFIIVFLLGGIIWTGGLVCIACLCNQFKDVTPKKRFVEQVLEDCKCFLQRVYAWLGKKGYPNGESISLGIFCLIMILLSVKGMIGFLKVASAYLPLIPESFLITLVSYTVFMAIVFKAIGKGKLKWVVLTSYISLIFLLGWISWEQVTEKWALEGIPVPDSQLIMMVALVGIASVCEFIASMVLINSIGMTWIIMVMVSPLVVVCWMCRAWIEIPKSRQRKKEEEFHAQLQAKTARMIAEMESLSTTADYQREFILGTELRTTFDQQKHREDMQNSTMNQTLWLTKKHHDAEREMLSISISYRFKAWHKVMQKLLTRLSWNMLFAPSKVVSAVRDMYLNQLKEDFIAGIESSRKPEFSTSRANMNGQSQHKGNPNETTFSH